MTLLERTRALSSSDPDEARPAWPARVRVAALGLLAALIPLALIAVPVVAAWMSDSRTTVPWSSALGLAATIWALAHGAGAQVGDSSVRFMPWLLTLLPLWSAYALARQALTRPAGSRGGDTVLRRLVVPLVLYVGGYLLGAVLVVVLGGLGPARPGWPAALVGALVVALVGAVGALWRSSDPSTAPLVAVLRARASALTPAFVRRAVRPALLGVGLLGTAGLVIVVLTVAFHLDRIAHLHEVLGTGIVGGCVLTLAQLLALPNVVLWAIAWCAGPGVAVGDVSVTWTHVDGGVLPLVPALGALPRPGSLPVVLALAVLIPVACGTFVAWRVVRSMARLSGWQDQLRSVGVACAITATVLALGTWLAGGGLGSGHLAHLGAPPLLVWLTLLVELSVGAAGYVCAWRWHLRR